VCGAPTPDIVLHRIPERKLTDAEGLGFQPTSTLRLSNGDAGYTWSNCPQP
jgi:hypothetical protein